MGQSACMKDRKRHYSSSQPDDFLPSLPSRLEDSRIFLGNHLPSQPPLDSPDCQCVSSLVLVLPSRLHRAGPPLCPRKLLQRNADPCPAPCPRSPSSHSPRDQHTVSVRKWSQNIKGNSQGTFTGQQWKFLPHSS